MKERVSLSLRLRLALNAARSLGSLPAFVIYLPMLMTTTLGPACFLSDGGSGR